MLKQIRILRIISNLGIGGIQKQLLLLLKFINKEEIVIDICTLRRSGELESEFKKYSKVTNLKVKNKYSIIDLFKLVKIMKKERYDIVHIHRMEDIVPLSIAASVISNIPFKVIHYHFPYKWSNKRKKFIENLCLSCISSLICVSKHVHNHTLRHFHLNPSKCKVIYNGVEIHDKKDKQKKYINCSFVIGIVSRIVYFKRIEDFIKSCCLLSQKWKNLKYIIVGEGEKKRINKLLALQEELGIKDRVIWEGKQKEIFKFLALMDVGVMSSEEEGLGNVVLEYMAAGLPVVATSISSIKEIVEDKKNGLLVSPRNPALLFKAISEILINRALAKKISLNGKRTSKKFSISNTAKQITLFYSNLF